jgi:hypothetical protein
MSSHKSTFVYRNYLQWLCMLLSYLHVWVVFILNVECDVQ